MRQTVPLRKGSVPYLSNTLRRLGSVIQAVSRFLREVAYQNVSVAVAGKEDGPALIAYGGLLGAVR
jgi:hypothetical protein